MPEYEEFSSPSGPYTIETHGRPGQYVLYSGRQDSSFKEGEFFGGSHGANLLTITEVDPKQSELLQLIVDLLNQHAVRLKMLRSFQQPSMVGPDRWHDRQDAVESEGKES